MKNQKMNKYNKKFNFNLNKNNYTKLFNLYTLVLVTGLILKSFLFL